MFRRSKEEIINIVGDALRKGWANLDENIRGTGEISYYGSLGKIVIYKDIKNQEIHNLKMILFALLEYFNLEVVPKDKPLIRKKNTE